MEWNGVWLTTVISTRSAPMPRSFSARAAPIADQSPAKPAPRTRIRCMRHCCTRTPTLGTTKPRRAVATMRDWQRRPCAVGQETGGDNLRLVAQDPIAEEREPPCDRELPREPAPLNQTATYRTPPMRDTSVSRVRTSKIEWRPPVVQIRCRPQVLLFSPASQ